MAETPGSLKRRWARWSWRAAFLVTAVIALCTTALCIRSYFKANATWYAGPAGGGGLSSSRGTLLVWTSKLRGPSSIGDDTGWYCDDGNPTPLIATLPHR